MLNNKEGFMSSIFGKKFTQKQMPQGNNWETRPAREGVDV
jgi:hypothetical protein